MRWPWQREGEQHEIRKSIAPAAAHMMELHSVFVICRNDTSPRAFGCYADHGEKAGMTDAIAYDTAAHAKKFRSVKDAEDYIEAELPAWGRGLHHVEAVKAWDVMDAGLPLYGAMLNLSEPIPDEYLRPTKDRLWIWMI